MVSRALVIKLADIGDALTATPALRALRETYPAARVDLLTTPHAAAAIPPELVDTILTAPRNIVAAPRDLPSAARLLLTLRTGRYDAVLVLHHLTLRSGALKYRLLAAATGARAVAGLDNGNGRWLTRPVTDLGFGAVHEVEYGLQVAAQVGAHTTDIRLAARFDERDMLFASRLLLDLDRGPWVALHPGSGGYSLARRWPADRWAALADELARRHAAQIILVGSASDGVGAVRDAMQAPALDLSGLMTLPQLAALLSQCNLFLGADSGVMHLAAAAGVPVVALFGPSNHLAWGPWTPGGKSAVVRLDLDCSPCSYVGHSVGRRDGCPGCHCMADLSVEKVLSAVQGLLGWQD